MRFMFVPNVCCEVDCRLQIAGARLLVLAVCRHARKVGAAASTAWQTRLKVLTANNFAGTP